MKILAWIRSAAARVFHRSQADRELAEELRSHIQHRADDLERSGLDRAQAERRARIEFGGYARFKEESHEALGGNFIETFVQDLRFGLRMLRKFPGFATVILLTLALAIGMNTAVFSVVEAVLVRPLPYPSAKRLLWLASYDIDYESQNDHLISRADYSAWKDQSHSFESIAAYGNQDLALMYRGEPSQERIVSVAGDFWNLTGAHPALGRLFQEGAPHAIVLSRALFERRFQSDPHILGETVSINGFPFTITGVLPGSFKFLFPQQYSPDGPEEIGAYIAFPTAVMRMPVGPYSAWQPIVQQLGPIPYYVSVVARLRPGVRLTTARAEMNSIYARIVHGHSAYIHQSDAHERWRMKMLQEKLAGEARPALMVLLAAVGFVLLIASANVANLLLARATTRRREISVRVAMGAGRRRVLCQFLAEGFLLTLMGGAAGLLLARGSIALMLRDWPQALPRLMQSRMDAPILLATLALCCLTAVLFGLAPALLLRRDSLHDTLKDAPHTSTGSASGIRMREVLVAVEIALAIVLLTGAGLMVKSFWRMNAAPPGFDPSSILTLRVSLAGAQYDVGTAQLSYIHALLNKLQAFPGVAAAGIDCYTLHANVKVEGLPSNSQASSFAGIRGVSSGYLRAMGVPLLPQYGAGHWLADRQMLDDVLVNESFARSLARQGQSIVGRHISGGFVSGAIAGVVADFKYSQLDAEPMPEIYTSYELAPVMNPMSFELFVRMSGSSKPDASAIRKLVASIDPTQPVYDVQTLEQSLVSSVAPRRFNLFLLGTFAATALLLALIGIYGVIAYSVRQRTQEIGLRMALGAARADILRMVMLRGLGLAGAGILFGISAAIGLTRLMASLLYDVKPDDPATFGWAALLLTATALLACLAPALRAALVNPLIALHHE